MNTEAVSDLTTLIKAGRKFGTIYIDPPWAYDNQATRAATDGHYETMTLEQIAALPVSELGADNSHLHLWTTNGFLFEAGEILKAWGYDYKGALIWCKPGTFGIGNYWRVSHEYLLLGVRGDAPFMAHDLRSWVQADRGEHSEKPEAIRKRIEMVSPSPRLEMFARVLTEGWVAFGDQVGPAYQRRLAM